MRRLCLAYERKQMSANELLQQTGIAWRKTYRYRSIFSRLAGARIQLPVSIPASLGYRFYAHNLHRFYTWDWQLGSAAACPTRVP